MAGGEPVRPAGHGDQSGANPAAFGTAIARLALPRPARRAHRPRGRRVGSQGIVDRPLRRRELPCADGKFAAVVYGGHRVEVVELQPGLHTLSSGNLDDVNDERHEFIRRMLTLHTLDSAVTFLAVASRAFSRKLDSEGRRGVVLTGGEIATVSSTLLSLPRKIQQSIYQYSDGPPSDRPYEDLSALLRQVLSAGRSRKPTIVGENKPSLAGEKRPSLGGEKNEGETVKNKIPKPVTGGD